MRRILEDFYFGNIIPAERRTAPNSELRQAMERISRCEQQLREHLNETDQTLLANLIKTQNDIDSITACENFILGFRLGARLMMECMDENDGDMWEVAEQ